MVKIFSFFEDIPIEPFVEVLPWDWRTWSEYRRSIETHLRFPINFAAFIGHIPIRLAVMGMEAWDRAATTESRRDVRPARGRARTGALGLSSNLLDHDGQDRPSPRLLADDAEFAALLDVLAEYPGNDLPGHRRRVHAR